MKCLRPSSYICLRALLVVSYLYLPGCLEFESIEQPSSVQPGEMFTVNIEVAVEFNTSGLALPRLAVRLPEGWTIPGDSFACRGVYNSEITFSPSSAGLEESSFPSPEGYYWWVGQGSAVSAPLNGTAYATIPIQTDEQMGLFFLDYTVAYHGVAINTGKRSHGHGIEVLDEYTPRKLQTAVEGNTVFVNWNAPYEAEGLIGYNLYRDGQLLTTKPVVDTAYYDIDLPGSVFHYSVSSLYENGDEYVTPIEIKALIFSGGTGEPNAPYQIALAEQLVAVADLPALLDRHFVLIDNIDLDPNLPGARVFNRAVIPTFSGTFNGQGHQIQHLTMMEVGARNWGDPLGLFGALESGAQVCNLGITDVNVNGSSAPYYYTHRVAGLVGENSGDVDSCYVTGKIIGGDPVGGLVGGNDLNGQIGYCYSGAFVSGSRNVGGLAGPNSGSITTSYNSGSVSGGRDVGGLVSRNFGTIVSSYNTGSVIGEGLWVGGLVGDNGGSIVSSYSTGSVNGWQVGGLVGHNNYGSVFASFWDIQSSGQTTSAGGTDLTTPEMQTATTFLNAGWDFIDETANGTDDIWWIDEGQDYPRLWWELVPEN